MEEKIYELTGTVFNINSPKQLGDVLFNKLKIETDSAESRGGTRKIKKTPTGQISTRASELFKLRRAHPLINLILEFRELGKLKNTYIDVLPDLADSRTGRIYATFNQVGTATGRLASDSPNLQNIPARGEWGKEIRKAFLADGGCSLVSFDYSQIELRIAAHLAQDKKMIKIFKEGGDIHRATAAEINNISPDEVTDEMRQRAKTLNFGVLYGMSASAFGEAAGIPMGEAKKFIDEYFRDFQGIKNYIERTKQYVRDNGYAETLTGRRRYLPEIHSPNFQVRGEAERMAVNMPVQGLAADIIKMAMIRIEQEFYADFERQDVKMILQVHDELVFEIKDGIIEEKAKKIKEIMENVLKLSAPIVVEIKA
ncbi:MAG: DNA polymerase, partial [bacterium]|nr:DNA polymerase [bacterium]